MMLVERPYDSSDTVQSHVTGHGKISSIVANSTWQIR